MLDKILVLGSFLGLIGFLSVVIIFVAEPDLIIVITLMVALAMHDFWISVFKPREVSAEEHVPLEALPTGVSGKPATKKKARTSRKKSSTTRASAKS
jgi:hypothetical protein